MEANLNTVVQLVTISPLESSTFVLHSLAACSLDSLEFEALIDTQDAEASSGVGSSVHSAKCLGLVMTCYSVPPQCLYLH